MPLGIPSTTRAVLETSNTQPQQDTFSGRDNVANPYVPSCMLVLVKEPTEVLDPGLRFLAEKYNRAPEKKGRKKL